MESPEPAAMLSEYEAGRLPKKPIPLPIPKTDIYALVENQDDEIKSLVYCLYLTGARASELIQIETKDFDEQTDTSGNQQITVKVNTRKKKRGFPYRIIPLRSTSQVELKMLHHLLKHKTTYERLGYNRLFPYRRETIWRKLSSLTFTTSWLVFTPKLAVKENQTQHLYPHFLRHCRATHLVTDYAFNPYVLKDLMGWSSTKPANVYVNLDWRDASRLLLSLKPAAKLDSTPIADSIHSIPLE
jgi:integrase